jgi:hypothetical protein
LAADSIIEGRIDDVINQAGILIVAWSLNPELGDILSHPFHIPVYSVNILVTFA